MSDGIIETRPLIERLMRDELAKGSTADADLLADCRVALGLDPGCTEEREVALLLCEFLAVCHELGVDPAVVESCYYRSVS
jgi:hypothetical protein